MRTRERGSWWRWAVGLAVVGLALGVWALLARPSAVADEGSGEPDAQDEEAVVLKSIQFKSDFTRAGNAIAYLWDKKDKWADPGSGSHVYEEPEWIRGGRSNPVAHKKAKKLQLKLVLDVLLDEPGPLNYQLAGQGDAGYWSFSKSGQWPGPGAGRVIDDVFGAQVLPDSVGILKDKTINWTITINGEPYGLGPSGPHTVYRTHDTPCDGKVTVMRLEGTAPTNGGCCSWAEGKSTPEPVADAVWNNLAEPNDPPYEPGEGKPVHQTTGGSHCWELMDGEFAGECDEQALLMDYACRVLGLAAHKRLVRASTNSDCLNVEKKTFQGVVCPLIFAANPGPSAWQSFEGCCEVPAAGRYYALWPKLKADNDYDMAKNRLTEDEKWTQWYVAPDEYGQLVPVQGPVPLP